MTFSSVSEKFLKIVSILPLDISMPVKLVTLKVDRTLVIITFMVIIGKVTTNLPQALLL